jgi:hypothetical protein
MKALILWLFLIFGHIVVFATNDTIISNFNDQVIRDVIEFRSFYILTGWLNFGTSFESYIIKIEKNGGQVTELSYEPNTACIKSFKVLDKIVIFRQRYPTSESNAELIFSCLDTNLITLSEKTLHLPFGVHDLSLIDIELGEDSSYYVSATTEDRTVSPSICDILIYHLSSNGDSISAKYFIGVPDFMRACYANIFANNKLYVFTSHLHQVGTLGSMIVYDTSLNAIDTFDIPNDLYDIYSPSLINDSTFAILTKGVPSSKVYLSLIDNSAKLYVSKPYGYNNTLMYPAFISSLSTNINKKIFFCATKDLSMTNPYFGHGKPSQLMISKTDQYLNDQWITLYGGDRYYAATTIVSTSDGGCVLIATCNDTINHAGKRNILVLKLDSSGSYTNVSELELSTSIIRVFPNPANDIINVDIGYGMRLPGRITVYNGSGNEILQESIKSEIFSISIKNLRSGIYIIKIVDNRNRTVMSKFIKK